MTMYPLFSLAGKGVRIRATEDITDKIENIVILYSSGTGILL